MSIDVAKNVISAAQCRAARSLIGWSQDRLTKASSVSKRTIARFELGEVTPYAKTLTAITLSLQKAGIIFIEENGEGLGVRLRKKKSR